MECPPLLGDIGPVALRDRTPPDREIRIAVANGLAIASHQACEDARSAPQRRRYDLNQSGIGGCSTAGPSSATDGAAAFGLEAVHRNAPSAD